MHAAKSQACFEADKLVSISKSREEQKTERGADGKSGKEVVAPPCGPGPPHAFHLRQAKPGGPETIRPHRVLMRRSYEVDVLLEVRPLDTGFRQ